MQAPKPTITPDVPGEDTATVELPEVCRTNGMTGEPIDVNDDGVYAPTDGGDFCLVIPTGPVQTGGGGTA